MLGHPACSARLDSTILAQSKVFQLLMGQTDNRFGGCGRGRSAVPTIEEMSILGHNSGCNYRHASAPSNPALKWPAGRANLVGLRDRGRSTNSAIPNSTSIIPTRSDAARGFQSVPNLIGEALPDAWIGARAGLGAAKRPGPIARAFRPRDRA